MNHANRLRPRPLTPFIVADALRPDPAMAPVQADAVVPPATPTRTETPAARPARPVLRHPGELAWASAPA